MIPDEEFFERVCSKELPNTPEVQSIPAPDQALQRMTCREQEILRLLAEGSSNRDIAVHLDLNEKTVRNQMTVLFAKLGLASRTQAALWARDRGLGEKP